MAQTLSETVIPEDYDYKTPEHLIIWLDAHIGDPKKYHHLKKAFSSNIDPRNQTWVMLTDKDYDNLLRVNEAMQVSFGGVLCLLLAYTDANSCYAAFERYQDKRILLITSGSLGYSLVPRVIQNFRHVFTDSFTQEPYNSIYIFCLDIGLHAGWATEYSDYVQMFHHEADLLTRITRDMADFYFTKAESQRATGHLMEALRFYHWSKKLFLQYQKMKESCQKYIDNIDKIIKEIETTLRAARSSEHDDNNDGKHSEAAT